MSGKSNDDILEQYFGYVPSTPLAVVAALAFFVVSLPLFHQSFKFKNKLTYVLPFTGLVEFAGYVTRLYIIDHASLGTYVIMGLLIILAPNALAFANYKVLGKIIQTKAVHLRLPSATSSSSSSSYQTSYSSLVENDSTGLLRQKARFHLPYLMNEYGEVHGNRLATFFFLSDILAIFLQGSGGGMQGGGNADMGQTVMMIGLASQLIFFGVYTLLAIYVFVSPMYQESIQTVHSSPSELDQQILMNESNYTFAFHGLFWTISLLTIRNIYRVLEFSMGYHGYLAENELFMYLFDSLFIFIAFMLYVYFNFAKFLTKADTQLQCELAIINGGHGQNSNGNGNGNGKYSTHLDVHVADASYTNGR